MSGGECQEWFATEWYQNTEVKGKVGDSETSYSMLYRFKTVTLMNRQEVELEAAKLKTLRFALGVMRMDIIRNEYIRGIALLG